MKYQSLKNMSEEEKRVRKRMQKAKAQRKYYQKHKDYYKNYNTRWAKEHIDKKQKEIDRLNGIINDIEEFVKGLYIAGHTLQNATLDCVLYKLKKLKGDDNE